MASESRGTDQDASNRDDVTAEWRDDHVPSFFARWHRQNEVLLRETTAAIIAQKKLAATAGIWADLDTDTMIREIYEAREAGSRPLDRP
jgi:uncharacterized protein (DUF1786 family)